MSDVLVPKFLKNLDLPNFRTEKISTIKFFLK